MYKYRDKLADWYADHTDCSYGDAYSVAMDEIKMRWRRMHKRK